MAKYRIGLSSDILGPDGKPTFDPVALAILDDPLLEWEWFGDGHGPVTADDVARFDGICLGAPQLPGSSLGRPDARLRLVARFGVGLDHCDVPAITKAGILITNNPEGVRRSVASSAFAFILALVSVPFAFRSGSRGGGAMAGVGISFAIYILYSSVQQLFEQVGNLNQLPPEIAAWSPDAVFSLAGLYFFSRIRS